MSVARFGSDPKQRRAYILPGFMVDNAMVLINIIINYSSCCICRTFRRIGRTRRATLRLRACSTRYTALESLRACSTRYTALESMLYTLHRA
eukprot:1176124-Prorocentrum_minimum.AAC.1